MTEWCMTHPWMTFILIGFFILAVSLGFEQYFTVKNNKLILEEIKIKNNIKAGE